MNRAIAVAEATLAGNQKKETEMVIEQEKKTNQKSEDKKKHEPAAPCHHDIKCCFKSRGMCKLLVASPMGKCRFAKAKLDDRAYTLKKRTKKKKHVWFQSWPYTDHFSEWQDYEDD